MMKALDDPKAPVADSQGAQAPAGGADAGLDADDAKVNQIAMRNEAVDHLKAFLDGGISEEDAKVIFDRYDREGEGVWTPQDLRQFLFDLEEAHDLPRVVPDEVLVDVIKELQLNPESGTGLTWIDFKSYLIYLQQKPLQSLQQIVQKTVNAAALKAGVVVSNLPKSITKEAIFSAFSTAGTLAAVFLVEENGSQALVLYQNVASVANAVQLNDTEILGHKMQVVAFTNQEFPCTVFKRKPSALARALGKAFITIRNVDEKHHISATIKQGVDTASKKVEAFMTEHKVQEKLKDAGDKTTAALKQADEKLKVTATIANINEKYQLSAKAQQAKEAAKVAGDRVMANPHVQKVGSFLSGVAAKAKSAYTEMAEDTRAVIAEDTPNKPAAPVEMQAAPAGKPADAPAK